MSFVSVEEAKTENVSVIRYYFIFIVISIVAIIISDLLHRYFGSEMKHSIVETMVSALLTVMVFIRKNKRAPNKVEKNRLIWGCMIIPSTIAVMAMSLPYIITGKFDELMASIPDLSIYIWLAIFAFLIGIHYLGFLFIYGKAAKFLAKQWGYEINKMEKIK